MENGLVLDVGPSTEGIGDDILFCWDPGSLPLEAELDLGGGKVAGHLEADLVTGTTIPEQVVTRRGVSVTLDLAVIPLRAPDITGEDVCEELQVGDVKVLEVRRRATGNVLVV